MALAGESTLFRNGRGQMILTIPAKVASDSQFAFKAGDKVHVSYVPKPPMIMVWKARREN